MTETVIKPSEIRKTNRKCGDCTACCEGWLPGQVNGKAFFAGKPCHYLGCKGCTIYSSRPKSPCQDYFCEWMLNPELPEWMQPHVSGVIITPEVYKTGAKYWTVVEMGKQIDSKILNWILIHCLNNKINVRYQIAGGWNKMGFDQEFLKDPSL